MKEYIITEEQLQAFLAYLYDKPYKEVAAGIILLERLPVLEKKNENNVDKG